MHPRRRTLAPLAALLLLVPALAHAQPGSAKRTRVVTAGMTADEVRAVLGPPTEVRAEGGETRLVYRACARCREDVVTLRDGRVTSARLRTPGSQFVEQPGEGPRIDAGVRADTVPGRVPPPGQALDTQPWIPLDSTRLAPPAGPARDASGPLCPPLGLALGMDRQPLDAGLWRERLFLGGTRERIVAVPSASVNVPTGFGIDFGEAFVGVGYQARTRYTDLDDGAIAAGIGFGDRARLVGVEAVVSSYSTVRGGGPGETGGVSVKLHRAFGDHLGVAAGVENAATWGGSDAGRSFYGAATRVFRRDAAPRALLSAVAVTVGVGDGRFRSEDDVLDEKKTVNVFGAVGVQLLEPLSVAADWTGQDLFAAASWTPFRRVPFVINAGFADITGSAGDGARFIVSAGYGILVRAPFN
ncbi:MAG TPA: hypothetical protein VHG91_02500 [Longimicrobium sp.]|nr:hypothetical protein [Longimicrobium sp.]